MGKSSITTIKRQKTDSTAKTPPISLISRLKSYRVRSLRGRLGVAALILVLALLPAIHHTERLVRNASESSSKTSGAIKNFQTIIEQLERSLQSAESSIYHYTLLLEDPVRENVLAELQKTKDQASELSSHALVGYRQQLQHHTDNVYSSILTLEKEVQHLLSVVARVETRYPAAPILLDRLQPTSAEFMSALEQAIDEARENASEPQQKNVMNLLREIRYAWLQQIGSVRVYIANRSGIFGQPEQTMANNAANRQIYSNRVLELLTTLRRYDEAGMLGFQQSNALSRMLKAVRLYENDFLKAAEIYTSENWRADIPLLDKKIRPLFQQSWEKVYELEDAMERVVEQNTNMLVRVSDSLANTVLLLIGFVGLVLLFGFLLTEYVIRRPIVELTKALRAEGRGESYLPHMPNYTTSETDVLIDAFKDMREQVRSRQTRMKSILDNAGEGIITIDANGIIETFNTAAQKLFGYSAKEALGQHCNKIIPLTETRAYGDFLVFCQHQSPLSKSSHHETVLSVKHRDGSMFPMSINVSDIWDDGRQMFIAIVEDISERMALMENLRMMAEHDSLTGLYNRDYFMTELDRVVENIKRGVRNDFALLYIDLDNFKFVNDTLGHLAGDQLLIEITDMLNKRTRKSDLLARLGGDEFALLIYGADEGKVVYAAESYRKLLADYIFKFDGKIVNIGCSIGVTMFGQEALVKEDILVQADLACHIAKRNGRNRIHVYKTNDQANMAAMSEDMGWATRIKNAISENRFLIACQPIVDARTHQIARQEVLLRLCGDDGGIIYPSGFLPSAERFGLMHSIDRWVVEHAIELLGQQIKQNPETHFSVNLSAKSLEDATMYHVITDALDKCQVKPTSVTFEITENVAIANMSSAIEFLNRVRDLGCQTALDDFGVGYSSFTYLKDLPVDLVKIDGSFVRNMQKDVLQYTMVRSMNDIAHALGKMTVAEYVDSEDCLDKLQEIGVDFVQGYYTGKPSIVRFQRDAASMELSA